MAKKTKRTKKATKKPTATEMARQFTLRIPPEDLEWIDQSAEAMRTSRQKLLATVIRGMRLADEESNKQGTFFNMYTNHLSAIIEESMSKKHGR